MPLLILWGRDALAVYNRAFAELIGDLHPGLLGYSAIKAWPAAFGWIGTCVDAAWSGRSCEIRDQVLGRHDGSVGSGCRVDIRSSPIADEGGSPAGVLCIITAADDEAVRRLGGTETPSTKALLLTVADSFRSAHKRDEVIAIALRSMAQEVGASEVGHAETDLVRAEATFEPGQTISQASRRTGTIRVSDLAPSGLNDLNRGKSVVAAASSTASALIVPLVRENHLRSLFLVARPVSRPWLPADVALVEDIASRAWEAIDRIQAAATLRRNQARQGFLLVLGDRLRELEDPDEIMETTAESLGRHLRVARAGYGEIAPNLDVVLSTGWSDGSVPPVVGDYKLGGLGDAAVSDLTRGLTATLAASSVADAAVAALFEGLQTSLVLPLIRDGKLRGALFLGSLTERSWSADEIALVGEVAARLWEALERARAEAALHDLNATLESRVAQRTQELTTSEARFRTLFANAPAPIFLIRVSSEGEALYDAINAATERFMGVPARDLVGHGVSQRISTGEPLLDQCLRSADTGQPVEYEMSIEVNGAWRTAECVLSPLPIEIDDTQLLIGIARDITAQRHAEDQLRQAQKMEAIGQLTGGIAHDFNNLLTGIIGSLALMEKRLSQGRLDVIPRYLGLAMTSANRAAALTHRLLAFSRRQPLEARPVDMNALVVSMDDLLRRTIGEDVVLTTLNDPDAWLTMCDPHQLENALLNLVINARDAMPTGGRLKLETANIVIDVADAAREPDATAGDYVVLAVTDTGIGMPPDVIARAFDPFFTTKPIGQGTGLGLSMIYGFAKQSEGHARIYSEVDRGTTVKIFLPRYRGRSEFPSEEAESVVPRAEEGETVLVVEDDETIRGLILEVLQDLGYRAIEAGDGPAGLSIVHSDVRIDLLITDVGLPGINGRQLAEQARTHRPDLSVLFITGYAENAAFGAGHLESGMQMMTKPFAVDELATRIRSILRSNDQAAGAPPADR